MATYKMANIDDWVRKTQARMIAVFRTAAQYTIESVQENTPVDTGFLRASLKVTLNTPSDAFEDQPENSTRNQYKIDPSYELVILGAEPEDVIHARFSANYAVYVEYGNGRYEGAGMVRQAAQAWPQNVRRAIREAKKSVGGV